VGADWEHRGRKKERGGKTGTFEGRKRVNGGDRTTSKGLSGRGEKSIGLLGPMTCLPQKREKNIVKEKKNKIGDHQA